MHCHGDVTVFTGPRHGAARGSTGACGGSSGVLCGRSRILRRYALPVMLIETDARSEDKTQWLQKTWANVLELRDVGIPLCGMTWYSLTDQVDWDTALREENDRAHPVGVCDMTRRIRPVGQMYKTLIREWQNVPLVPNGSASGGEPRTTRRGPVASHDRSTSNAREASPWRHLVVNSPHPPGGGDMRAVASTQIGTGKWRAWGMCVRSRP